MMESQEGTQSEMRTLIDRVTGGNPQAFDELIGCASRRLRSIAHVMLRRYPQVRRWEDTDDVLQGALMRLHRALQEVNVQDSRQFYALAVLQIRRCVIDLLRHHHGPLGQAAHHDSQGGGRAADDEGGVLANAKISDAGPESLQQWSDFHEAVEQLPEDEKEVFTLIWYGGLMRKDVAKLLQVAEKTVLRRFTRARLHLQAQLEGEGLARATWSDCRNESKRDG